MNRRKFFFQTFAATTTVFLGSQALYSCKKENPAPTIDDFLDTAKVEKLNAAIIQAPTLAALPADIKTAAASITTIMSQAEVNTFATVDLNPVIQFFKTNIVISASEKTMLQANDAVTLSTVLNRMLSLPSFTSASAVSNSSTAIRNNSQLSTYSANNMDGGSNLYAGDYYQCALDNQKFIQDDTIPKLEKILALKATGSKKSASVVESTLNLTTLELQIVVLLIILVIAEFFGLTKVVETLRTYLKTLHSGG